MALGKSPSTFNASNTFTPEKIGQGEILAGIKLSPDGQAVLYLNRTDCRAGDYDTSAIWIADVHKAGSARPLTSGLSNDDSAVFHPDCERVFFLSDRHKAGGPRQIYSINVSGGEASLVIPSSKDNERGIPAFEISPDGRFIAFLSEDEPSAEDRRKEEEKDDVQVFGDLRGFQRLRVYAFSTGAVRTLNIAKDRHVDFVTWKPDSKEVLFSTISSNTLEAMGQETRLGRIAIAQGSPIPTIIGTYPRSPAIGSTIAWTVVWRSESEVAMLFSFTPETFFDSRSLYITTLGKAEPTRLYGETEDAEALLDIKRDSLLAVSVVHGVGTRVDIIQGSEKKFTIFDTDRESLQEFDIKLRPDGTYVFVALTSSSIKHELLNVRVGFAKAGERVRLGTTLSAHMGWMKNAPALHTEIFNWKGSDGIDLQGLITFPTKSGQVTEPLPTILLPHGGPYWRDVPHYCPTSWDWTFMLASRGYLILCPNYRGSQGRGSAFARAVKGEGNPEWGDCESMVDEAVRRKLADPNRLGIGGWSYGGFLTAWGVTQTKNKFKAGVMGAGVSDKGQQAAGTDLPDVLGELMGSAPWTPGERVDIKRSPIRYVTGVETPLLILHGEADLRVPVSQAISMMRGLKREGRYPERFQLVIYPREGHIFKERAHAIDLLKRVIEHFDTWL